MVDFSHKNSHVFEWWPSRFVEITIVLKQVKQNEKKKIIIDNSKVKYNKTSKEGQIFRGQKRDI